MTTALKIENDLASLESDVDASLGELQTLLLRGVQLIVSLGRPFFQIHRRKLYKQQCDSWHDYCQNRFGVSGERCRQIADAYEIGRTLSASAGIDGSKDPTLMLEYLASVGFSDLIARSLKIVPVEQQSAVFDAARSLSDGGVTPQIVEAVALEAYTMPLEWAAMTKEEQFQTVKDAEQRLGAEWDRQRCVDWAKTILKRNRAPLEAGAELPLWVEMKIVYERQKALVEACDAAIASAKAG